jgi:diguanylate cyclase (GGDEF)-like protein
MVASCALAGFGLAAAVTVLFPLDARIALPFSVAGLDPKLVGLIFWILVCLVTSSRGTHEEGHAAFSFGTGPTIAAAAIGGPVAAVWVALIGNTELRELRGDVPWYGAVANHGMVTFSWGGCGLVMAGLRGLAGGTPPALVDLAIVVVAAGVGLAVNALLAIVMVSMRTGRHPAASLGIGGGAVTLTFAAEACLAWLIAQAYALVAWWSPMLLVVADAAAAASLGRHRAGWQLRHHQITELPNAIALGEHASDLRRTSPKGVCVFYIDLDGFKAVNDDHDHLVGDDVLRVVGRRLVDSARDGDFVAHLHGDEFLVLGSGITDDDDARAVATRLVAAVEPPITHRVGELRVSATVGHHLVTDLGALSDAIREADRMMATCKEEKARGQGRERRRT